MLKKFKINQNGLSLLEVLISILVITIGILGIAPLLVVSIEENTISREYSDMSNIIKEEIEFYQSLDPLPTPPYVRRETGVDGKFNKIIYLDDHASDTTVPNGLYQLKIDMNWVDNQDVDRSKSIATYILPN